MPYPKFLPATTGLIRAHNDDVWVSGSVRAGESQRAWFVISRPGRVLARVDLATDLELLDAGSDFVLTRRRDSLGVEQVLFFRRAQ